MPHQILTKVLSTAVEGLRRGGEKGVCTIYPNPGFETDPWCIFPGDHHNVDIDVGLVLRWLILKMVLGQHHAENQNLVEAGIPQNSEGLFQISP